MRENEGHLSHAQFLILKFNLGLTPQERAHWMAHLDRCGECRRKHKDFDDRFKQFSIKRKNLSHDVMSDLLAIENNEQPGDLEAFFQALFQRSLGNDESTQLAASFPSLQEGHELPIEIPAGLKSRVYRAMMRDWHVLLVRLKSELAAVIVDGERTFVEFILDVLGLAPAPVAPELIDMETSILEYGILLQHPGGDLWLRAGKANIRVELYSKKSEEKRPMLIADSVTDEEGVAKFQRISPGDYRAILYAQDHESDQG